MDNAIKEGRVYGCRFDRTRVIKPLPILAERIIDDLSRSAGTGAIPAKATFSALVRANFVLQIHVGGLSDELIYADWRTHWYSEAGTVVIDQVTRIVETYNWSNSSDPGDRRYVCHVWLAPEAHHRSIFWTPGTVRAF